MTATVNELDEVVGLKLDSSMVLRSSGQHEAADELLLEAGQLIQENMIRNAIAYGRGTVRELSSVSMLSIPVTGDYRQMVRPLAAVPDVLSYGVLQIDWRRLRHARVLRVTGLADDLVGLADFTQAVWESAISDLDRWWLEVPSANLDLMTAYRMKREHIANTIRTWMSQLHTDELMQESANHSTAKWGRIARRNTVRRYLDRYPI